VNDDPSCRPYRGSRRRYRWPDAWPCYLLAAFAALALTAAVPGGPARAVLAVPVVVGVPGALTLGAAQARRSVDATAFGALAVMLSALWLAFATLILAALKVRINGVSVYVCLLLVCCALTAAAQWQMRRRAARESAALPAPEPADALSVPDEAGASASRGARHAVAGVLAGVALLAGGVVAYTSAPHQEPAGYTWLAWSGAKPNGVVEVGARGISLPFEITRQAPGATEYRLTASWTGDGRAHALAPPRTLRVGGDRIVRGTLSVPQPPGGCAYRVVVTLTELGTARPQSRSINVGVRANRGAGGPAGCAVSPAPHPPRTRPAGPGPGTGPARAGVLRPASTGPPGIRPAR
jgi:hypothetical protein